MDTLLDKDLVIDKSAWTKVKLGDVVYEPKESVKDFSREQIDHVVGLEHIDTDDIHLRRSESIEVSTTFTKKFATGDVLFGRRRAYLKKAAQTSFSGICSGDITVMRAKDALSADLLPFIIHNEKFFDYAVTHSAGGLSPRVKFKDLANYEFLLPPKEQQSEIAELLLATDDTILKERDLICKLQKSKNALFHSQVYKPSLEQHDKYFGKVTSKFNVRKLGLLLDILQYGISESLSESGEIPILRMNNLQAGTLDLKSLKYYSPNNNELDKFILNKGDVLFNRTNSFDLVGKVSLFNESGKYSFASYLIRLKTDAVKLDSRYLSFFLNSSIGMAKVRRYRTPGVSQSNINAQNLRYIPIPLPSIIEQVDLMDRIEKIESSEALSKRKLSSAKLLLINLINQVF